MQCGVIAWMLLCFLASLPGLLLFTRIRNDSYRKGCYTPNPDEFVTYKDHWQNVTPDGIHYVYSAFIDGNILRIIGATRKLNDTSLYCHMWSHDVNKSGSDVTEHVAKVRIHRIKEGYDRRYTAAFFVCNISQHFTPFVVSVVPLLKKCRSSPNIVAISKAKTNIAKKNFSICLAPLQQKYNEIESMIEWIELNRIMGAEHFTFYNYSMGKYVSDVVDLYVQKGLINLLPWQLPMLTSLGDPDIHTSEEEIHYYGQLAAQNDCLYRNRGSSEFVVFIDLDEFIVPHKAGVIHWSDMIKDLPKKCGFMFRNSFFGKFWKSSNTVYPGSLFVRKYHLITLLKSQRENFYWEARQRSKLMVRPDEIESVGIHRVLQPSNCEHVVNPSVAFLHHYRYWKGENELGIVVDITMNKYSRELIAGFNRTISSLNRKWIES